MTAARKAATNHKAGFTLVELLVVMVIMGLVLAFAPLAMHSMMPSLEVQAAARQLGGALRNARSIAIRDNREATLTLDLETRRYALDGDRKVREIDEDIEVKLLTATSEQLDEEVASIRFFPDGTSTGGAVTLSGGGASYAVQVDWLTGRIEIVDAPEK
ncbi:MAG: GspH/FimT family pseudopilin [Rhodospirillales bacterium]|nr:GspH/FimT family pseudopilin [Rhodospirillales bacterium]